MFTEEELNKLKGQTKDDILQRLYRINQSREAEIEDHRGRCRTLEILLSTDMDWMAGTIISLIMEEPSK